MEPCALCGKPMVPNHGGKVGDPVWICLTDNAAHRTAAAGRKAEREAILRAAKESSPPPDPAELERIAAWERPDQAKVTP